MAFARALGGVRVSVEHGLAATLPAALKAAPVPGMPRISVSTLIPPSAVGPAPASVWTATGLERQVFLDRSGRRRRSFGALGALGALLAAVWLTALMTGSVGFSNLPALPSVTATVTVTHATPATYHARIAVRGTHVAGRKAHVAVRETHRHTFKVADVEQAAAAKELASGAFGRLARQIQLD
jgi:hypothetical protein